MTPAEALGDLAELQSFLAALNARQLYGEHVCMAAQPDTVNGSPEILVDEGVTEGARITAGWGDTIVAALAGKQTEGEIRLAIRRAGDGINLEPFAKATEELILRGLMLGALDSVWERENDEDIAPAKFTNPGGRGFVYAPFSQAVAQFEQRAVLPPAAFKALEAAARRRAFTVAGLARQELLDATHAELLRQLAAGRAGGEGQGANLRDFDRFARERLESAGWTPKNPSHVETIYRTNIMSAVGSGRAVEMSQPAVVAALPYWQIRGVTDARQRETHKRAHGIVLPANHPFWLHAYPPFGFNCRCRVIARTLAWLKRMGIEIGPVPVGLPDPGFESGTRAMISVPPSTLQQPQTPPPAPVRPPIPRRDIPLPSPSQAPQRPFEIPPPLPVPATPKQAVFEELGINTGTVEEFASAQAAAVKLFGKPLEAQAAESILGMRHVPGKPRLLMRGYGDNLALDATYRTIAGEETMVMRRFKRKPNGDLEAYHALFEVDKRLQGRGIARNVLRDQIRAYQRLGVKRIRLSAAWTGRYTWTRMGFEYADTREAFLAAKRAFKAYAAERVGAKAAAAVAKNINSFRDLALVRVGDKASGQDFFDKHYENALFDMKLELNPSDPHFQRVAQYLGL